MFDLFGIKALKQRVLTLEKTVNGAEGEFGLIQHIYGTDKPGQEGLWRKVEQLEKENARLKQERAQLQGLESLIKRVIEEKPEMLVKMYDVHKLEELLLKAVNKQLENID